MTVCLRTHAQSAEFTQNTGGSRAVTIAEYNSSTANGGTQYIFLDQQSTPRTVTSSDRTIIDTII
ncbi:MAG TPA: hypothetical protein VM941_03695 [Pyrinomonadaceae bacterium]|nr:hypothetical protein [Pyrinomonadaceae bacterium]